MTRIINFLIHSLLFLLLLLGSKVMNLPFLSLPLVRTRLQRRDAETVTFGLAISSTGVDLNSNRDVEAVSTRETGLLDSASGGVLGAGVSLTLVERLTWVLRDLEIAVVGCVPICGSLAIGCDAVCLRVCMRMRLRDERVVSTWHRGMVVGSSLGLDTFLALTRVLVKELEQGLIGLVVQMVDLVALRKQVCDGLWWRLVGDSRANDVWHITPILLRWDVELRVAVEATKSRQMHVTTKDGDADVVLLGDLLKSQDEVLTLLLVLVCSVMVVKVYGCCQYDSNG